MPIAAYIHPNPDPVEQTPDPEPGNYYVSVPDDSRQPRLGLLLGPFTRHAEALANVGSARIKACECDWSPLSHRNRLHRSRGRGQAQKFPMCHKPTR
jgi:hypothetical protein